MLRFFGDRRKFADLAFWRQQLGGRDQFGALIALIAARVLVPTEWTDALDVAVGQKQLTFLAEQLLDDLLVKIAVLVQLQKDILTDLGLFGGRSTAEIVEFDVEPVVDLGVQLEVLIAQLLRRAALLQRLRLGRRAVFVRTANVQTVSAS